MFDYQAGEKYKLTLIMVGVAGLMVGMFFAVLFMPSPEASPRRVRYQPYMSDPDVTGRIAPAAARAAQPMTQPNVQYAAQPDASPVTDPAVAINLIEQWLPLAWDLNAHTAKVSQEKAIQYMTADCAAAYRQNIWTADLSKQIDESGLESTFRKTQVSASSPQADGSVVISVLGEQVLNVPNKGSRSRKVKLEYLVKQTSAGLRIAGISEVGQNG